MNNPLAILQTLDRHLDHPVELIDLILTKMMRGADPEDFSDIEFLLKNEPVAEVQLRSAFERLRLPDIQELHESFRAAQPKVLALVQAHERGRS